MPNETNVGTIAVDIVAKMDNLEKNLKSAGSSFAMLGGVIAGATAKITDFALNAAGSAVSKLADMTSQAFQNIDANLKLANSYDANINGLRGITFAGSQAGASAEEVGNAFSQMSKFLGDALNGEQKNIEALDKLGLKLFDLTKVESDQAFLDIAEAIAAIPNASQRAAASMDVFGKAGKKLLPLITSDIKAAQEEFKKMGGFLKDGDAQGIERANDAISKLVTQISILAETLAVKLAPSMEKAANILTEKVGGVTQDIAVAIVQAENLKTTLGDAFSRPFNFLGVGSKNTEENQKNATDKMIQQAIIASDLSTKAADRERAAADAYWEAQDAAVKKKYDTMAKEAEKQLAEEQKRRDEAFQRSGEKGRASAKAMMDEIKTPLEKFNETISKIEDLKRGGFINDTEEQRLRDKAAGDLRKTKTEKVGFAGVIEAGGVSAEAMRAAARQVQVVSDPQLAVTNQMLTKIEKKIGNGTAVTV